MLGVIFVILVKFEYKKINYEPHDEIKINDITYTSNQIIIFNNCLEIVSPQGTGSMKPVLGSNSTLLLKKIECIKKLNIGDIIYFKDLKLNNSPIVHRIIGKQIINGVEYYKVKGDNNDNYDGLITKENIKYLVIGIIY